MSNRTIIEINHDALVRDAKAVVAAVTLDDCGMMVGNVWQGGNGGLLSRDTLKAVDRLRLTLAGAGVNGRKVGE